MSSALMYPRNVKETAITGECGMLWGWWENFVKELLDIIFKRHLQRNETLIWSFPFSDRNELIRERERERERDRGYLSDHNSRWVFMRSSPSTVQFHKPPFSYSTSRCASCIGESARAQWFRHSDGWRSGSSTLGSGTNLISQGTGHRRSPWDSLPSLKQDGSLNDSGYKSTRADSFEQRLAFDIYVFSHLNTIHHRISPNRHSENPLLANLIFEKHCKKQKHFLYPTEAYLIVKIACGQITWVTVRRGTASFSRLPSIAPTPACAI